MNNLLSHREIEIMELVSEGYTTQEIGKILSISETTVISHRQNIKTKLSAKNTSHCVSLFLKQLHDVKS